ncbi:hypothetical protein HBI17_226540 [Parastagonospora nodorum]|nr:hypothetical protein HBH52_075410 [Parastagonospora nodorum]KAH5728888.1 hypothetical protein HBI17_226540 [Parastagonospora nodorum]
MQRAEILKKSDTGIWHKKSPVRTRADRRRALVENNRIASLTCMPGALRNIIYRQPISIYVAGHGYEQALGREIWPDNPRGITHPIVMNARMRSETSTLDKSARVTSLNFSACSASSSRLLYDEKIWKNIGTRSIRAEIMRSWRLTTVSLLP